MKKIILSALCISSFMAIQAQTKDSTNCDKLNTKLNATIKLYTDSFEQIRLRALKANQVERKQFYADSIAGKLAPGSTAPVFMTPALKEQLKNLNSRKATAVKTLNAAIKRENCK